MAVAVDSQAVGVALLPVVVTVAVTAVVVGVALLRISGKVF